jgi:C-terminal processing protease CtpA/Prc
MRGTSFMALAAAEMIVLLAGAPLVVAQEKTAGEGPVVITGSYEITDIFYEQSNVGFALVPMRTLDFWTYMELDEFYDLTPSAQIIGAVEGDATGGSYTVALPGEPLGVFYDTDGDPSTPSSVKVFETLVITQDVGRTFLSIYDSPLVGGWYYNDETGEFSGVMIVWSAEDGQRLPVSPGADRLPYTEDDLSVTVDAGWNIVNITPINATVYRDRRPVLDLHEGPESGLTDLSGLDFGEALSALLGLMEDGYAFTKDYDIDWAALRAEYVPLTEAAHDYTEYHHVLQRMLNNIPDGHVGWISWSLYAEQLGEIGASVTIADDGNVYVTGVIEGMPAQQAGLAAGTRILAVDGLPVHQAMDDLEESYANGSTERGRDQERLATLLKGPVGSRVSLQVELPDGATGTVTMTRQQAPAIATDDPFALPVEARLLAGDIAYLMLGEDFFDNLLDDLFARQFAAIWENALSGLILDMRGNSGGIDPYRNLIVGHFLSQPLELSAVEYPGDLDPIGHPLSHEVVIDPVSPGPFAGTVVVLTDDQCFSQCEYFVAAMQMAGALVVGHTPTGGLGGSVGGQALLPGNFIVQYTTGRSLTFDRSALFIEGTGVIPDIRVPLTRESIISPEDEVLTAGIQAVRSHRATEGR